MFSKSRKRVDWASDLTRGNIKRYLCKIKRFKLSYLVSLSPRKLQRLQTNTLQFFFSWPFLSFLSRVEIIPYLLSNLMVE